MYEIYKNFIDRFKYLVYETYSWEFFKTGSSLM